MKKLAVFLILAALVVATLFVAVSPAQARPSCGPVGPDALGCCCRCILPGIPCSIGLFMGLCWCSAAFCP